MIVLLDAILIAYIFILQRSNIEYKEKNRELESENKYCDETKAECKAQENNYNDRLDNITQALVNCSNSMVTFGETTIDSSNSCTDLRSNYTDIVNKYIVLTGTNNKLNSNIVELTHRLSSPDCMNIKLKYESILHELSELINIQKLIKYIHICYLFI